MIVLAVFIFLTLGYGLYRLTLTKSTSRPSLPPGPKGWPILGNINDLPPAEQPEYQHWLKHKEAYGTVSSVTTLGQTIIVIHEREALHQLLEQSSLKTSGRPNWNFISGLCGYGELLGFRQYTSVLKRHRKCVHMQMGTPGLVAQYDRVFEAEVSRLLMKILETPQHLLRHIATEAASIILKITYDYSIQTEGPDPLVKLIQQMMANLSLAMAPMSWSVDILPILRYLPEWCPGVSFHKTAKLWKKIINAVSDVPYTFVQEKVAAGTGNPCYVSNHITRNTDDEDVIKLSAANMYAGGSDTTVSSFTSFVLAMTLYPDVQRRAQAEIDSVTGGDRLPQFSDRSALPYVDAVVQEALRWFPITPMGIPHTVDEETTVKGFLAPKGSIILPAIWWLLHDPQVYEKPESFDPSRFLEPRNEPNPSTVAFGYGRRICPGRWLADASLFLTIAQLLAVYNMQKGLDDQGRTIEPVVASTVGLIDRPAEFPYRIKPRSDKHTELIKRHALDYPWEDSDSGLLSRIPEELHPFTR